jgi:hypothetical protein
MAFNWGAINPWTIGSIATEVGKESASRLFGDNSYDIRNPFETGYAVTPNTSAVLGNKQPSTGFDVEGWSKQLSDQGGNTGGTDQTQTSGSTGSTGGRVTAPSKPAYSQQDLDYLNNQEGLYNSLMGSADRTLASGLTGINDKYTLGVNNANTQYGRATSDYDQKEYDTKFGMQNTMRGAKANSRSLADSVRRILGLAGAAGGTAMQDAMGAVAQDMTGKENAILGDYGANMAQVKKGREDTKTDYDNLLTELQGQKQTAEQNLRAGVMQQKQGLNNSLAQIASERAKLLGGNPVSELNRFQNQYLDYQRQIDDLPNQFRNAVTPRDVKIAPVSLKDYFVDKTGIQRNERSGYSPYAQFLQKKTDEEEL